MLDNKADAAPKPFWTPNPELMQFVQALGVRKSTNWASPIRPDGTRPFSVNHVWLTGALTDKDVAMLSRLELDDELNSPLLCTIFRYLMKALPAAQRPSGAIQGDWIDLLLGLMPLASHGTPPFGGAKGFAAGYVNRGQAPLLLVLYMLLLRSDTWVNQIHRQLYGPLQPPQPLSQELSGGYDQQTLIGDPCSFEHVETGHWDLGLMIAREHFFSFGLIDGKWNRKIQDLLFSLDVMVRVAASLTSLSSRVACYDTWMHYKE